MEDKTVLGSHRACGDLEYCTFRDSMRADAYAERRKQKFRLVIDRYLFFITDYCTFMYPITDMQNRYLFTVIK